MKRSSIVSEGSDNPPSSPGGCNGSIKSFSSTSTLDSIAVESSHAPPLPAMINLNVLELRKFPVEAATPGWGVVLRGTTSELKKGKKIYTCHVESVHDDGAAKMAGLRDGDQIVGVDRLQVKHLEHIDIVKIFQSKEKMSLTVLPAQFKLCSHARIIKNSKVAIEYVWALMRHLQVLEIINVNLGKDCDIEVDISSLLYLKNLAVNHCSLLHHNNLKGLDHLIGLESLSLAHNLLTSEGLFQSIHQMSKLKKLDLSRNILVTIPECICTLSSLEILILVDNNITELPYNLHKLKKLHTLCLDGNLLREVDSVLRLMDSIQKLTISNNCLECESEVVKLNDYLIACIEGNPFCSSDSSGICRNEPSLRRTLSVRGQLFAPKNRHSLEWDSRITELKLNECDYNIVGTQ